MDPSPQDPQGGGPGGIGLFSGGGAPSAVASVSAFANVSIGRGSGGAIGGGSGTVSNGHSLISNDSNQNKTSDQLTRVGYSFDTGSVT
jgi:hypothetical protein